MDVGPSFVSIRKKIRNFPVKNVLYFREIFTFGAILPRSANRSGIAAGHLAGDPEPDILTVPEGSNQHAIDLFVYLFEEVFSGI